jgi:hypothetical protein
VRRGSSWLKMSCSENIKILPHLQLVLPESGFLDLPFVRTFKLPSCQLTFSVSKSTKPYKSQRNRLFVQGLDCSWTLGSAAGHVYICIHIYIYIYIHIHKYIYIYACVYYIYTCVYTYIHRHIHRHTDTQTHGHTATYTYIHIQIPHIHIHIQKHTHIPNKNRHKHIHIQFVRI